MIVVVACIALLAAPARFAACGEGVQDLASVSVRAAAHRSHCLGLQVAEAKSEAANRTAAAGERSMNCRVWHPVS